MGITMSVADFLTTVYGNGSGFVHLSTTNKQLAAVKCADVLELVDKIHSATDVYLSAAVIGSDKGSGVAGRIEDSDASELTALWVDLDRAGEPGHKTKDPLWTRDDIGKLWEWLPIQPTTVVDSGGGWWFYYVLTEPVPLNSDGSGELLLARWARWWEQIGETYGRKVDSVFNPGRICRAPGSVNNKNGNPRLAKVTSIHDGRRYSVAQLDELLPAPEPARFDWKAHRGDGERPGDAYNQAATVSSVVGMLEGQGFHSPKAKGQRVDLTRSGKNARDGHSVTVWPDASVTFWSSATEGQPGAVELRDRNGASGTYDPFGLYVAVEHRGDFEAAARKLSPSVTVIAPSVDRPNGGTLAELMAETIEPIRFVVEGLIPEGLTIFAGKPKLGKSWLALLVSLCVCAGNKVLNHPTRQAETLYVSLEDGKGRIQDRVRMLGGDELGEALEQFHYRTTWPPLSAGGIEALDQWMVDHPETRLIVLDTFGKARGALKGKDKYQEEYELAGRLQTFASTHRVAVVIVHHIRKQGADDWLEAISGSQAITGAADAILGLFRERGQMDATLRLVSRDIDEKDIALKFDNGLWESMGDAGLYRTTVERSAILQAIKDLGGQGKVSDIASLVEKTSANTSKLLTGLADEGLVVKVSYGVYSLKGVVEVVEPVEPTSTTSTTSTYLVDQETFLCPDCGFGDGRHSNSCPRREPNQEED